MGLNILQFNKTHFLTQLEDAGHKVIIAGVPEEQSESRPDAWSQRRIDLTYTTGDALQNILEKLPQDFVPDRIVYHDDSYPSLRVTGWEQCLAASLFYSVDAHIHSSWHSIFAGMFDHVLVAQKDYLPHYLSFNAHSEWFPLWAPKLIEPKDDKTIEVCFRGNLNPEQRPERVSFLKQIAEKVPLDYQSGPYEVPFSQAKIILNEAIHDDVNFRVFEALSSGGMLLTPRTGNGLTDLFIDGEDLVLYEKHNVQDASEKINYYLNNEYERKRIAQSGRFKAEQNHTEIVRGAQFTTLLQSLEVRDKPRLYYSSAYQVLFSEQIGAHLEDATLRAGALLNRSIQRRETFDHTFTMMLANCGTKLPEDEALSLALFAAESFPDEAILKLLVISLYQRFQREQDAINMSKTLSDDYQSVIELAELSIAKIAKGNL